MKVKDLMLGDSKYQLPMGYVDKDGANHDIVTLTYMTGKTEEDMEKPKVKQNSGKVITELLYGVIDKLGTLPKTNKEMIRDLSSIDRDYLLVANAIESFGKDDDMLEFVSECTKCGEKNEVLVMLPELDVVVAEEDAETEHSFKLKNGIKNKDGKVQKDITIILPTGRVQEIVTPILQKNTATAMSRLLHSITKSIGDIEILNPETFANMSKRDRDYINKYISDLDLGVDFKVDVNCFDCGNAFKAQIPIGELLGE